MRRSLRDLLNHRAARSRAQQDRSQPAGCRRTRPRPRGRPSAGCGGFETVAARPPQPPSGAVPCAAGPQPARRLPTYQAEATRTSQRWLWRFRVRSLRDLLNHRAARSRAQQDRSQPAGCRRTRPRPRGRPSAGCGGFETVAARPPQPPSGTDPTTAGTAASPPDVQAEATDVPALAAEVSKTVAARPPQPPSGDFEMVGATSSTTAHCA